jgi:stringent starvation protein B
MLKFIQQFLEKTTNLLIGNYIEKQNESYEAIMDALDSRKKCAHPPPEDTHSQNDRKMRQAKKEFFAKALQGGIASLYLDPRVVGVIVPEQFRGSSALVLNYSYRYHIADFDFNDERVIASLSFGGFPFQCVVPWDAVTGIGNHTENAFYSFTDSPPQVDDKAPLQVISRQEKLACDQKLHGAATERRKQFRVIKGEKK